MKNDDVMIEIRISLSRDGTIGFGRNRPSGAVNAEKALVIGMLDVAKSMVLSEMKPGKASEANHE